MKYFVFVLIALSSFSALAQQSPVGDRCEKYHHNAHLMRAIERVALNAKWTLQEMCNLERIWDVQAERVIVINRQGEEIPHVRVQLHRSSDSCLYMVRDADLEVTSKRCFSTW